MTRGPGLAPGRCPHCPEDWAGCCRIVFDGTLYDEDDPARECERALLGTALAFGELVPRLAWVPGSAFTDASRRLLWWGIRMAHRYRSRHGPHPGEEPRDYLRDIPRKCGYADPDDGHVLLPTTVDLLRRRNLCDKAGGEGDALFLAYWYARPTIVDAYVDVMHRLATKRRVRALGEEVARAAAAEDGAALERAVAALASMRRRTRSAA